MRARTWKEHEPVLAARIYAAMKRKDMPTAFQKLEAIQVRVQDDPKLYQRLIGHSDAPHTITTAAVILYSSGPGPDDSGHKLVADAVSLAGDLLFLHDHRNWDELTEIAATIYAAAPGPGVNDAKHIQDARDAAATILKGR